MREFLRDPEAVIKRANVKTFAQVSDDFVKRYVEGKLRSEGEIRRILNKYVLPRWGERPFEELKRDDVTVLLDRVEDDNGARQANAVLAVVRKLMNWFDIRDMPITARLSPRAWRV